MRSPGFGFSQTRRARGQGGKQIFDGLPAEIPMGLLPVGTWRYKPLVMPNAVGLGLVRIGLRDDVCSLRRN
jgi:hypothetical protein